MDDAGYRELLRRKKETYQTGIGRHSITLSLCRRQDSLKKQIILQFGKRHLKHL